MPRIDNLRQERSSVHTIQMQINRMSGYVCFFEGRDDIQFYFKTIEKRVLKTQCHKFNCGGKEAVLKLLENLKFNQNSLPLFFIDKDFDGYLGILISHDNLFVTDGHSFENYLVSQECLSELLEYHCFFEKNSDIYHHILKQYQQAYQQFTDFMKPFMKWWIECLKNNNQITFFSLDYVDKKNQKPIVEISDTFDIQCISEQDFKIIFKNLSKTENANIKHFIDDLDNAEHYKWLHGKYALNFMVLFYKKVQVIHNVNNKKQNNETLIEFLSTRIEIPVSLKAFLSNHIH